MSKSKIEQLEGMVQKYSNNIGGSDTVAAVMLNALFYLIWFFDTPFDSNAPAQLLVFAFILAGLFSIYNRVAADYWQNQLVNFRKARNESSKLMKEGVTAYSGRELEIERIQSQAKNKPFKNKLKKSSNSKVLEFPQKKKLDF